MSLRYIQHGNKLACSMLSSSLAPTVVNLLSLIVMSMSSLAVVQSSSLDVINQTSPSIRPSPTCTIVQVSTVCMSFS